MMKHRLCTLVLVLWSGCGGGSGSRSPGSSATSTDFCHSMVDTMVDVVTRCYGGSESYWRDLYASIVACDKVDAWVADRRLAYDPGKGADCLSQLSRIDCNFNAPIDSCPAAIAGHVAVGSQCSYAQISLFSDCAPGNFCQGSVDACGGICRSYVQPGGSCAYTAASGSPECAPGSSCQSNTQLCIPDAGEGQPCQGPSAADCADGLYCDGDFTTGGTCRKGKTSGACTWTDGCAPGYTCSGPANGKTCNKIKVPGDSCTQGYSECTIFSFCGNDGKCTNTGVGENEPCGSNAQGEYIQCGTGLHCAGAGMTGTCQKQKPAGSPCAYSYSGECAGTSSYCDPTNKVCVACD